MLAFMNKFNINPMNLILELDGPIKIVVVSLWRDNQKD